MSVPSEMSGVATRGRSDEVGGGCGLKALLGRVSGPAQSSAGGFCPARCGATRSPILSGIRQPRGSSQTLTWGSAAFGHMMEWVREALQSLNQSAAIEGRPQQIAPWRTFKTKEEAEATSEQRVEGARNGEGRTAVRPSHEGEQRRRNWRQMDRAVPRQALRNWGKGGKSRWRRIATVVHSESPLGGNRKLIGDGRCGGRSNRGKNKRSHTPHGYGSDEECRGIHARLQGTRKRDRGGNGRARGHGTRAVGEGCR